MKIIRIFFLAVITLFLFSAFSAQTIAGPKIKVYVGVPVVKTVKPGPKYVWVAGHYKINKYGKKVWVQGHWKRI
jgi:hypothetical protein